MTIEELTGRLHAFLNEVDHGTPVMIGHRFLTDIHSIGFDILTFDNPVIVIESTGEGYDRLRPEPPRERVLREGESPKSETRNFRDWVINRFWS